MNQPKERPVRKRLPHDIPSWVSIGDCYFITICTEPRGRNHLANPFVADSIAKSFRHNMNRGIWWADVLLVMPDHIHALMKFPADPGIRKSLSDWKHFLARTCQIEWQRDFFEHRLRDDENHIEKAHYVRMNPVRGGLVEKPEDWPFVWTFEDEEQDGGQGLADLPVGLV